MDKETADAMREAKEMAGINPEVEEALSNSKKPFQRLGQGILNGKMYYGTSLKWRGKQISAIVTSDKKIYLGVDKHIWKCNNCNFTAEVLQPSYEKAVKHKGCECKKSSDCDFQLVDTKNQIKDEFGLNYRTEFNDEAIDYCWQTESIRKYVENKYKKENIKDIFEKIADINKKYVDHLNPALHKYIAAFIIGTYCFTLFEQFGRLYFRAEKGSGKTKQSRVIRFMACNPMWITKGTESSIFRDAEATCGTFIVDNMDKLHEDLLKAIEHLIETGWMWDATYRLTDKDTGRTQKFLAYTAMVLNNIFGLDDNTIDKTFEVNMLKSVNDLIKRSKPTCKSDDWQEISDSIRYWMLDNWQIVKESYDKITADFSGREFDVVEGVLAIAKLIDGQTYNEVCELVKEKIAEQSVDLENNPSYQIFSKIWTFFVNNPHAQEGNVFTGILADELFLSLNPDLIQGTKEYSNKKKGIGRYISGIIKSVPMFKKSKLSDGKTYIPIKRKDIEQYLKLQHFLNEEGHLHTTTTSTTSTKSLTSTDKPKLKPKQPEGVDVSEEVDQVDGFCEVDENIKVEKIS